MSQVFLAFLLALPWPPWNSIKLALEKPCYVPPCLYVHPGLWAPESPAYCLYVQDSKSPVHGLYVPAWAIMGLEEPGGVMRSQEEPGEARRSQEEPAGASRSQQERVARRSQEKPGGASRSQEERGGASRSEEPGGARRS